MPGLRPILFPSSTTRSAAPERGGWRVAIAAALTAAGIIPPDAAAQTVNVTIDRTAPIAVSQLSPGLSQIDHSLDFPWTGNNGAAVARARTLVASGLYWVNNHIMAWGVRNPWPDPAAPGPTEWSQLDAHLLRIVDWGATPIITLCEAPWWMKGRRNADGTTSLIPSVSGEWGSFTYRDGFTDHRGLAYPPGYASPDPYGSRILDNHMDQWLTLVEAVARRYMVGPYHVRHFQVWNELKGYHNPTDNRWDYSTSPGDPSGWNAKHGYTYMYNRVFERLVAVAASLNIDPAEIAIGGPYVVMASGESANRMSHPSNLRGPWGVMDRRALDVISYWLANKAGAGFVCIDGGNQNKFGANVGDAFSRCEKFAAVNNWIRQQPGGATLPIWWSEWYTSADAEPAPDNLANALGTYAAMQQILSGAALTLLWGGQHTTAARPPLWTPTSEPGGGQALPWYYSYRNLGIYFGPGTRLYASHSSSADVAALASATHTLLVNKTDGPVVVNLDGMTVVMSAYDVVLLEVRTARPRQWPSTVRLPPPHHPRRLALAP